MREVIYWLGFHLSLAFWRVSEWLDRIPGFSDGSNEAYNRHIHRNPPEDEEPDTN
jgi:hypothetical protein